MESSKMCLSSNFYYKFLLLFLVLEICSQLVIAGLPVKYLPGFEGPLPFELETGYIGVGENDEVQLFYYFIKSQSNPRTDPLILWHSGGPGCSTLNAVALELGPMMFDYKDANGGLPTLSSNQYGYTQVANIVFVDIPVGTGFSYATTVKANHSDNLQTGEHAYQFIRKWFGEHAEYLNNPFYVGGDSYCGISVPILTKIISDGIDSGIKPWIDLKGYILGNPVTDIPSEDYYRIIFSHGMGLISDELYESLLTNCGENYNSYNHPSNALCSRDIRTYKWLRSGILDAHILEPMCDPVFLKAYDSRRSLGDKVLKLKNPAAQPGSLRCRGDWFKLSEIWSNYDNVREALHVRKGTIGVYEQCRANLPFTENVNNTIPYHAYLSTKGLRSLIYSGDHDLIIPFVQTQAWIKTLNYSIIDDWRPWIVDGQVAGYTRSYSNRMTYVTVKGAGHTAPNWAPTQCLAMLKRWLSNEPI